MSQHAKKPYLAEHDRSEPSWSIVDGKIIHINNSNKTEFKARINKSRLNLLRKLAVDSNQH